MQYGVIMAGGAGTRLWPLSRHDRPKQLLNVVRGKSLLQLSYERLRGLMDAFQGSMKTACDVVARQPSARVTVGIIPAHGHTGLGYIHRGEALGPAFKGAYKVQAFKEKPDKATADRYVESGRYYWNS